MPVLVTLLRAMHVAGLLSALGAAAFIIWFLPAGQQRLARGLRRIVRISAVAALLTGGGWLVLEGGVIAGADSVGELVGSLPIIVTDTRFGQVVTVRLILLIAGAALAGSGGVRAAAALAAFSIAAMLEGLLGHAGATPGAAGTMLLLSEAVHLLAAGLWLGSLLPLWMAVRRLPTTDSAVICERFSPVGLGCVVMLAGTGLAQGLVLIGDVPALLGTPYGHIALLKIALFAAALGLAAYNRLWLTDRMTDRARQTDVTKRLLLVSVGTETALGLAVIGAAAVLASSVPGVHDSPVWPLSWRFTLATIQEDADFQREVIVSAGLIGSSFLLIWCAFWLRRLRLIAIVLFGAMVVWRGSSMTLLTAEAYPTSFQNSPSEFAAASIVRGETLFAAHCAGCHGADGTGTGPQAAGLRIKPDDLTQSHIWEHDDGDLFWWISHGIEDPEGGLAMPGFAGALSATDRWAVIDYVHALAAGAQARTNPMLETPVRAPTMGIACRGWLAASMADLAGRFVLVTTSANDATPTLPGKGGTQVVTLLLSADGSSGPSPGTCLAQDETARAAYAVLAGVAPDHLAGSMFLIDPAGWVRVVHRPADGAWSADGLRAAIAAINRSKIEDSNGGSHEHHH